MAQQPLVGKGLRIIEASRSHTDTPHTGDQPEAETSTWQHTTLKGTDIRVSSGMRTRNRSKWAAAGPRLRPRGYWDRQIITWFAKLREVVVESCCIFRRSRVHTSAQKRAILTSVFVVFLPSSRTTLQTTLRASPSTSFPVHYSIFIPVSKAI
jgi:hypothetical protein